jgi:geranylgeranylglycerol-phosphate geranylgeranyltransferase
VNWLCLVIATANSVLLYFYARNLKTTLLMGNICVAYLTGSTFLFGGSVYGFAGMALTYIPFWLSSLATMSREIMKDIEDMKGDSKAGARTLPILAGEKLSGALGAFLALVAVVLSYQPKFGIIYLVLVIVADIFLIGSVWKIIKMDASGSQRALKLGMTVALLAFLAAALRHATI